MSSACLACGAVVDRLWLRDCADYYLRLPYRVTYCVCDACGLVQQSSVPADTGVFYPEYPQHIARSSCTEWARRTLLRNVYYRPPADAAALTLLDAGCGDGTYLAEMSGRFGAVLGYEPGAAHAARLADRLGVPVLSDANRLADGWAGKVDVVTAHMVLEHVTDLRAAFHLWATVLRPGGRLHVAVPNIRSWEARMFGRRWHGLDAPRHISFPDSSVIARLGAGEGLRLDRTWFASFPNTLSASIVTVVTGRYHHALFMALMPIAVPVAALAPQGTLVCELRKEP